MKKIFLLLAMCACVNLGHAQVFKAYVSGGFTVSQIEGDEFKGFDKWGGFGGVGAMISVSKNNLWNLGVEINFGQRGTRNSGQIPYNIKLPLNYIEIPLMVYFQDPYGGLIIGAGFQYGRLVQQPHGTIYFGPGFVPDTSGHMLFNMNDVSVAVEGRFRIWKGLYASLRWQRSLMPIKHWTFTEGSETWTNNCYNSALTGRLIWQFGDNDSRHGRYSKKKHYRR